MEDLTGKQLGQYQVIEPLGEGGMAAVYKAFQPGMERYVALKILPRVFADDPTFVGRFKQEAQVIAKLTHINILPIFDFGTADGYTYIVMPYIKTGDLSDVMRGDPLPLPFVRKIISQIGDALQYAHSHGLVHRDIKPSNILIDERENCLLSDFGIAKIVGSSMQFTQTGAIIGTPAYMSPEQINGEELDGRNDIYSLGIVLYEMVTGRPPFKAETPPAILVKHLHDPMPPPRKYAPDISEELEAVILKSLARDREDRYTNVSEMVQALKRAIPEDLVLKSEVFEEKLEVAPTLVEEEAPGLEVTAEELPVLEETKTTPEVMHPELEPAEKPKRKVSKWVWWLGGLVVVAGIVLGVMFGSDLLMMGEPDEPTERAPIAQPIVPSPEPVDEEPEPVPEINPALIGTVDHPIRVLLVPSGDVDLMIASSEAIEQALNEATGFMYEVSVPTSHAATIEEMCASTNDTIGFTPALGYALANQLCGVEPALSAIHFGWNVYWTQFIVRRDSGITSIEELDGKTWGFPGTNSMVGYIYPSSLLADMGITPGDQVDTGEHNETVRAVYNDEVDFGTTYFSPPVLPEGIWNDTMSPDIPDELVPECYLNTENNDLYCGAYRVMDARVSIREEQPDVVQVVQIIGLSPEVPNHTMSFSSDFPEEKKQAIIDAVIAYVNSEACEETLCNQNFYNWTDAAPIADENFDGIRIMIEQQGITLDNIDE